MMMEIKDSRGRKVSLLNDELPRLSNLATATKAQQTTVLPPLQHRPHSYFSGKHHHHSSIASESPPSVTPSLCRSDSSDSAALNSPSPPTPLSSGFEHLRQALPKRLKSQIDGLPGIDSLSRRPSSLSSHHPPHSHPLHHHHPYHRSSSGAAPRSSMDFSQTPLGAAAAAGFDFSPSLTGTPTFDPLNTLPVSLAAQQPLPNPNSIFDTTLPLTGPPAAFSPGVIAPLQPAQPVLAPQQQQPPPQQQQQPPQQPQPQQQRPQKKNSYPCPLSKQYNCGEFFTTSGHAARHAKKHTGKKDAICPECGKGFTRKDNMEQHRRTHANGRNAHHNSTSSASSNSAASTSPSTSSSTGNKSVPKNNDPEESKARKKAQQQRKARPSSISTSAPTVVQPQQLVMPNSQPSTATSAIPPSVDVLDPVLREQAFGYSPTSTGAFDTMFPYNAGGLSLESALQYQAPHAPMRASGASQNNAARMRIEHRGSHESVPTARPRQGPTSPSLAPKLDALALVAEGVRRRDSDSSR